MNFIKDLETKSAEIVKNFKDELSGIRGGRPVSKLVEDIQIDYFGQKLALKQLGSISVVLPREIQITVWDKSIAPSIGKAVELALNVGTTIEGNLVRVNLPPLSEERRAELIKIVKKEAEEARIKIRSLRDDVLKKIKAGEEEGKITEDDRFKLKEQIQKNIDKTNEEIEKILENKIKEISE